jgi:predicted TPR repeat methyltransferase
LKKQPNGSFTIRLSNPKRWLFSARRRRRSISSLPRILVYFGDLQGLIAGAARCLKPGGLFAFNIETADTEDFVLLASGRFGHNPSYVAELAAPDFTILKSVATTFRLEANRPVPGVLFVLQRR